MSLVQTPFEKYFSFCFSKIYTGKLILDMIWCQAESGE